MNYELKNKVALVTGGSRGLGAAISIALANSGAKVAINYHSRTAAARQLQEKIATAGGSAEIFQADVTQEDEVKKLCDAVVERWAAIDILVVNATLIHVHKSIENLVWKDMLDHLEFFVKSPLLLVQQVVPTMKKKINTAGLFR